MKGLMNMFKLTEAEEITFLKDIIDNFSNEIGIGSSRQVFEFMSDKVIKVAADTGGINQNKREIELFRKYGRKYLAEIYAYGEYIIIMEKVETVCADEIIIGYEYEYAENLSELLDEREYNKIISTYNFLTNVNGCTSDNYQLGIRENGDYVAYDYGYESYSTDSIGDARYYALEEYGLVKKALKELMCTI
jgi:hypothetical protein